MVLALYKIKAVIVNFGDSFSFFLSMKRNVKLQIVSNIAKSNYFKFWILILNKF